MYLLYLDESGNPDDPADKHFVLAGAAVFERQTFFLSRALDAVQTQYFPQLPPIEFHASHIRSGNGFWRGVERSIRDAVLEDLGKAIASANDPGMALFAAVIEKSNSVYGEDAVKRATAEISRRFDIFLTRRYNEAGDPQRGLLIFAEGKYHLRAKVWARGFRELGTDWGVLRNLSDIPYFASVRDTRLLQVADFVSHAVFRLYEKRDGALAGPILQRFDQKEGILHGSMRAAKSSKENAHEFHHHG